ncbi:MAG: Crp/Fnr family transcriptional regulator [Bdellovibrionales bacterium]|nr:Crp/Fnr family transcriptional regulator [Bdellovibrionales bacterium]
MNTLFERYAVPTVHIKTAEFIFEEGAKPSHFYSVKSGRVRMFSVSEEGKEFIQGRFGPNQHFGEPPFFCSMPYPASAVAEEDSIVWKCSYDLFFTILKNNYDFHLMLTRNICQRLHHKSMMLREFALEEATHRLTYLFNHLAKEAPPDSTFIIPCTRQQLANMTGLRIETVIRCIKKLESDNHLTLTEQGKIVWNHKDTLEPFLKRY